MNGVFKNRKFWLVAVAVAVACGLFAGNYALSQEENISRGDHDVTLTNYYALRQYVQAIRIPIARMVRTYNLDGKSLSQIDFSYPDDESYGDKPELEIFNPEGGGVPPLTSQEFQHSFARFSKTPRIIFTLGNKVRNKGSEQSDLIAVIPDIHSEVCQKIQDESHKANMERTSDVVLSIGQNLNLIAFPSEADERDVVVLPYDEGCIKTPDGYYYYQVLVER